MSLPLERWAREEIAAVCDGRFEPRADKRLIRDLDAMRTLQRLTWAKRQRAIRVGGMAYAMPEGTYGGLLAYPPAVTVTTSSLAATTNLWPQATYSPVAANSILSPQAYRVAVMAKITTAATPGNIGLDPRIGSGTWTTVGTAITGTTLGASGNVGLTASITNAFYLVLGDITIRASGTTGSAVGMFHYVSTQATASGLAGPAATGAGHNLMFGGTAATIDWTAAQGFGIGAVHTVTTITHNIEQIHFMDWN